MKNAFPILLAIVLPVLFSEPVNGDLIAHYTFDTDYSATVGTNAIPGSRASISNVDFKVGGGSLALGTGTPDTLGNDGAVSGNSFNWGTSDIRSAAFWMKAVGTQDANPTMYSLGSGTATGNRFDVRIIGGALRLELQGGGFTTPVNVGNGDWYHVVVAVTQATSTLANVNYYVHDANASFIDGGAMTGTTSIITGIGPLRMGDSYQDTGRDFFGFMDDVRLYDNALSQSDAQNLALLGTVPEPSSALVLLVGFGLAGLRRRR